MKSVLFTTIALVGLAYGHREAEPSGNEFTRYVEKVQQYEARPWYQWILEYFDMHSMELLCFFILAVYFINYFIGKKMNRSMALNWLNHIKPVLADNFSVIGTNNNVHSANDVDFEQYSANEYSVLCNGRENLHYALLRVTLKSRHELMSMAFATVCRKWSPERDSVWIEIPIERHPSMGDKTINSEILIASKKDIQSLTKSMPHIEKILFDVTPQSHMWDGKHSNIQVLAENQESVEALTKDARIMETIVGNSGIITAIHLTDQRLYNKFDLVLKVHLRLEGRDMGKWGKLMKDILYIADHISKMKVSYKTQQEVVQRRKKLLKVETPSQAKKSTAK